MNSIETVGELLKRCGQPDAVLPPTALFNEGWMLRLVLDWASRHRSAIDALSFDEDSTWYSEALLGSRFRPRKRGDSGGEGFTHADGVIGHFRLRPGGRGDIELLPGARQLTIVEAKMASGLSTGTKRAPAYNQAARIVACIAHLLSSGIIDSPTVPNAAFVLVAPAARIAEQTFAALDKAAIAQAVEDRAKQFDAAASEWCNGCFKPLLARIRVMAVAWENILAEICSVDPVAGGQMSEFYSRCLLYNPLRPSGAAV